MKITVNDIVNIQVAKSGKTITRIAQDIGLSRVQLSKILRLAQMEMKYVIAIGKSIRFDFAKYFPELNTEVLGALVDTTPDEIKALGNSELRDRLLETQAKYVNLLEEYIQLLRKYNQLEQKND